MTREHILQQIADLNALVGQLDAVRAAVMGAAAVGYIAEINQLFEIIRDILAVIAATQRQLTHRQFFIADIEKNERLNVIDVTHTRAVQFSFDHFQTATVQTFDSSDSIKIILVHSEPLNKFRHRDFYSNISFVQKTLVCPSLRQNGAGSARSLTRVFRPRFHNQN